MPRISTYQTVTPQGDDTIIISQANGSPADATKNITVNSLTNLVQEEAGMLYIDTEISSAELLSIDVAGIELVPQPTNGDIVFIKNILAKYTFGTTPYTRDGQDNFNISAFYYIDNVYSPVSGSQSISLTWDESRNTISSIFGNAQVPTVPSSIKLSGSNVIGGDGTLKVRTYYGVIPSTF
jgi:hypothetical protein